MTDQTTGRTVAHPPRAASSHIITHAQSPLYRRLARKEARLREDQFIALSRLVRILARRRTARYGPRLTENTLIRVAIDLLLTRADQLAGNTEDEIRASALRAERHASQTDTP